VSFNPSDGSAPPLFRQSSRPGRSRTFVFRLSAEYSSVELRAVLESRRRSREQLNGAPAESGLAQCLHSFTCSTAPLLCCGEAATGAGGIRTPTSRLKRPICCLYTTTPFPAFFGVVRFSRVDIRITSNQFLIRRCFERRHSVQRNDQPGRHNFAYLK